MPTKKKLVAVLINEDGNEKARFDNFIMVGADKSGPLVSNAVVHNYSGFSKAEQIILLSSLLDAAKRLVDLLVEDGSAKLIELNGG
jgi:hypothetical protein